MICYALAAPNSLFSFLSRRLRVPKGWLARQHPSVLFPVTIYIQKHKTGLSPFGFAPFLSPTESIEFPIIGDMLQVSDSVLSKHLKHLEYAGYVKHRGFNRQIEP